MSKVRFSALLSLAAAVLLSSHVGLAQSGRTLTVAIQGLPAGVSFDVVMSGKKLGTQTETGTAPQSGTVAVSLSLDDLVSLSKDGKPDEPVAVWVNKNCPDGKMRVQILEMGLQPNDDCDQGWVMIGSGRIGKTFRFKIDWPAGLDTGGMGTGMKVGLGVGVPAAILGGVAAGRGGSNATSSVPQQQPTSTTTGNTGGTTAGPAPAPGSGTTPAPNNPPAPPSIATASGSYLVVLRVLTDPNGHRTFVLFDTVTGIVFTVSGNNITLTGASPWVMASGPIDASGNFTATGRGLVAGRQNVPVNVIGRITVDGQATFTVSVGGGGSLPGNVNDGKIDYEGTGRKQ